MNDPYQLLGVARDASAVDIKSAFRRAAALHHPDRNPGDPDAQQRFSEINGAFQLLSDPDKRAAYDRYGSAAFDPSGNVASGGGQAFVDLEDLQGMFGDILGAFGFGRRARSTALRVTLTVSFEQAALGCREQLSYEAIDLCDACGGRGAEPDSRLEPCGACGGSGRLRPQGGALFMAFERSCPSCRGLGRVPRRPCRSCRGKGLESRRREIEIELPPGIEAGNHQVIAGAGHRSSPDQPPGELEVVVQVEPHPQFRRVGDDVVTELRISFVKATVGGTSEVPTLEGSANLRIPPGTQSGAVLRMRGKGIARARSLVRGDLLVRVAVDVPERLSPRARRLIEELGEELGEPGMGTDRSFVDRLRGIFN